MQPAPIVSAIEIASMSMIDVSVGVSFGVCVDVFFMLSPEIERK
jgi:hypothetical protein